MSVFMAMIAGLKTDVVARCSLALEKVALRQQLAVLERSVVSQSTRTRKSTFHGVSTPLDQSLVGSWRTTHVTAGQLWEAYGNQRSSHTRRTI
jgi:hypothetical protein